MNHLIFDPIGNNVRQTGDDEFFGARNPTSPADSLVFF